MGLLAGALSSPHLRGDTERSVSGAHKGSEKDIFFKCQTLLKRNAWKMYLGIFVTFPNSSGESEICVVQSITTYSGEVSESLCGSVEMISYVSFSGENRGSGGNVLS